MHQKNHSVALLFPTESQENFLQSTGPLHANSSGVETEFIFIISFIVQIKLSWFVISVGASSYSMDKAINHCQKHSSLKTPSPVEIPVLTGNLEAATAEAGTGAVGGLLAYKALMAPGPLTFRCKTCRPAQLGYSNIAWDLQRHSVCCSPLAAPTAAKIGATSHQDGFTASI